MKLINNFLIFIYLINIVLSIDITQEPQSIFNLNQTKDLLLKKELYFIRSDDRDCKQPHCGGFWLKKINDQDFSKEIMGSANSDGEIYISEIMVSDVSINSTLLTDQKQFQIDQPNTIIVSGELTADHSGDGHYHCLHLSDIYHLMNIPIDTIKGPKPMVKPLESYFFLKPSPLICNRLATNCPSIAALKSNTDEIHFISSYTEPYTQSIALLDQKWFVSRLLSQDPLYNSLAKGYILGDKLIISQVFSNTADPRLQISSQCPSKMVGSSNCNISIGQVPVFNRDTNRCPVFDKCVQRGPCHLGLPNCQEGYRLYSIPYGPKGCSKHYCDPIFLPNPISQNQFIH